MWNLAMVFMYFPFWCVPCPLYFLLSHMCGLFSIHLEHSLMVPLLFFIEYMCYLNLTNRILSVCPIYVWGQPWHFDW